MLMIVRLLRFRKVLPQPDEDRGERSVHFSSRLLTDSEPKYSTFERENSRVIFELKFQCYLLSERLKLLYDYQALSYVFNLKKSTFVQPSRRIWPWKMPSRTADYLSRTVFATAVIEDLDLKKDLTVIANYVHLVNVRDSDMNVAKDIKFSAR